MTDIDAREIAAAVALDGSEPHRVALDALLDRALGAGVPDILVRLVADPAERRVVRERALGRVVAGLVDRGVSAVSVEEVPRTRRSSRVPVPAADGSREDRPCWDQIRRCG